MFRGQGGPFVAGRHNSQTFIEDLMFITGLLQHRAVAMVVWMLGILLLLQPCAPALAQTQSDCAAKLKEAEQDFYNGDFDSSITILKECLSKSDFPDARKKDAYELLAQNYLAKSYLEEARGAIRKLLELVPSYVPPKDSPELVTEVENVKKEISEEKKPAEPPPPAPVARQEPKSESGGFPQTWHLIAGGAVVAGVAALLLLGGGSDEAGKPPAAALPGPPALP
jgi:tetratricopeptide (TPR) repeat protein